jgi:hypothetical protein
MPPNGFAAASTMAGPVLCQLLADHGVLVLCQRVGAGLDRFGLCHPLRPDGLPLGQAPGPGGRRFGLSDQLGGLRTSTRIETHVLCLSGCIQLDPLGLCVGLELDPLGVGTCLQLHLACEGLRR